MTNHPPPLRLALVIDRAEPLGGRFTDSGGTEHEFAGWSGLAAALTASLAAWEAEREAGSPPPG